MTARHLFSARAGSVACAMVGSLLLFGCGGGSQGSSVQTAQPAAARFSETATRLSVTAEIPGSRDAGRTELQSLQHDFAAKVVSGPDVGAVLAGSLMLYGERLDAGATEVAGRLLPSLVKTAPMWSSVQGQPTPVTAIASAPDAAIPTRSALGQQFEQRKDALKLLLRRDLLALSDELKQAIARGADAGASEPTSAQTQAIAEFRDRFERLASTHQADLVSAHREYLAQAIGKPAADDGNAADAEEDDDAGAGHDVRGTIDAQGGVSLKIELRDGGTIVAIGQTAADGTMSGTFTGPHASDSGTWSAMKPSKFGVDAAAAAPVPCASQAVKWSVGSPTSTAGKSTCKATYPGGSSGSSAQVSDITAPAKGVATASCTNGVVTTTPVSCATALPDCAGFAVSWTVAGATCKATYPGGKNSTSMALSDVVAPTQGTVTATCTNGVVSKSAPKCSYVGDPAKGQIVFNTAPPVSCATGGCHAGFPATKPNNIARGTTAAALNAAYRNISAMAGFHYETSLTSQQTVDLAAYIAAHP